MDIKSKINARKLVLIYFYEKMFAIQNYDKDYILDEVFTISKHINFDDITPEQKEEFKQKLMDYYSSDNYEQDTSYLLENFFGKELEANKIDFSYVLKIASQYDKYIQQVEKIVNENSQSFSFIEMDLIDRAIFLLGYIEYYELETPRKVVLNEMIELAKRYWDEGSQKLVNGIWHKIIQDKK